MLSAMVRFGSGIIAARLIEPESFGVFSAVSVFITSIELLSLAGLNTTFLRTKEISSSTRDAIITATWIFAACGTLILGTSGGFLARLAGHPEAEIWVRLAAPVLFLKVLASFSNASLLRDLEFGKVAAVDAASVLIGPALVTCLLAASGARTEALFGGYYAQHVSNALALIALRPPGLPRLCSTQSLRSIVGEGLALLLAQAGFQVAQRVDYWIIGRLLGAQQLGLYNRAFTVMEVPAGIVTKSMETVYLPVASRVTDPRERRLALSVSISITLIALGPIALALSVSAPVLVKVMLGPRWAGAAIPLSILVLAIPFRAVCKAPNSLTLSAGLTRELQILTWGYAVVVAIAAWVGCQFGVNAASLGGFLATCAYGTASCLLASTHLKMPVADLILAARKGVPINLVAGASGVGLSTMLGSLGLSELPQLILFGIGYPVILLSVLLFFPNALIHPELRSHLQKLPKIGRLARAATSRIDSISPRFARLLMERWGATPRI